MKRIITLALIAASFATQAQTVTFTVSKRLGCYVASVSANKANVLAAIATAADGVESMDANITVTVEENDVVDIYGVLTALPEGISAPLNDQLNEVLLPLLATRPSLAARIDAIIEHNNGQREEMENRGLMVIDEINTAIHNN